MRFFEGNPEQPLVVPNVIVDAQADTIPDTMECVVGTIQY